MAAQPALLTLAVVTLATGGIIGDQVIDGQQDADYLVLVPLVAVMFLVMVWHGRRRLAALEERLAALEEVQRVSRENLRLLNSSGCSCSTHRMSSARPSRWRWVTPS